MNRVEKRAKWVKVSGMAVLASSILIAGCSSGGESQTTPPAGTGNQGSTAAQTPAPPKGPVKITIMAALHTPEIPSDIIEKAVEEKTNTQLDIQWVPSVSYEEKFQAALATGSLPQIAFVGNQSQFMQIRDAVKSGQFWEIGPLLKDYPNLSKLNADVINNMKVAGKLYSLPQEVALTRQGVIYRKDWADKLGLSAPKTVDDIYNMLKKFKEADLAGNKQTVPLADRNDLVYGSFKTLSSYFGTPNNWGVVDGKLTPEFMTKGYMDTMNFVKKLHAEGLINQDFPVTSKTDQQNLMYTGKAGMYIGSIEDVTSMQQRTEGNVKEAQYDVENRVAGVNGKPGVWAVPGYNSVFLFPKGAVKDENQLKEILSFVDKMFSQEVADLVFYGVEGTHYTKTDGKVVPSTDTKLLQKDVQGYTGLTMARVTAISPASYKLAVTEKAKNLIAEAPAFAIADPTVALDSKTFNEKSGSLQTIIKDATYQYMIGKIDEAGFQAAVNKWKEQGGTQVMQEFQAAYDAAK
jgi:putative aldouronate transport system substrate-binding protein